MNNSGFQVFFSASAFKFPQKKKKMESFRVGTLNVNGARVAENRALVFDLVRRKNIDVMFVQEPHSDERTELDWDREWEVQVVLSHMSTAHGGVGLLFSKAFIPTSLEVEQVVKGRCLLVKAKFVEYALIFINVYTPISGAERKSFLHKVTTTLNRYSSEEFLILGGDFNCTVCEFLVGLWKNSNQTSMSAVYAQRHTRLL